FLAYAILPEPALDTELSNLVRARGRAASGFPAWFDLLHLAVAPEWRRRGIGRLLVERFDPPPRQDPACVHGPVPPTHPPLPLQRLRRGLGYKAVRVVRQYYVGEDAYLMERHLA